MPATIGEISETGGEVVIEWKIVDYFSLPEKIDETYRSPVFYFSGTSWYLKIYPYGESKHKSKDHVGLYIVRGDSGPPVSATYILEVKTEKGEKAEKGENSGVFDKKDGGWGDSKFLSRSVLEERKSELVPSDVLTVTCSLKQNEPNIVAISLFRRLQNVSNTLKKVLTGKKGTDVMFKVEKREFPAHRVILESLSPVLASIFDHNTEKNRKDIANISGISADAFERVLSYMYSGEIDGMSFDNVFDIYTTAHKFDLQDLKRLCKVYVEGNLCVERVCDVIRFAHLHRDEEMELRVRNYFQENVKEVLETDQWKAFVKENSTLSVDLLSIVVKEFL